MNFDDLRGLATDALRYWEPRRFFYNALLAAVVLLHFAVDWPASQQAVTFNNTLGLFVLAVLANVAYCAAYPADLFLQLSSYRDGRRLWRAVLAAVGFAFAATLAHFFSLGAFSALGG